MAELSEIIIGKIRNNGPISFYEFMDEALYRPNIGYYNVLQERIGKDGDYYTSSSLTPAFGAMIARQIQQMWEISGLPDFMIVEYGAGTGLLCHDILNYFKNSPHLYDHIHYFIIERSSVMRERQKKHLTEKVIWCDTAGEIGEINGCILSNELIDNFAVHQVVMEDVLKEIFIDYAKDFIEIRKPADGRLVNYLAELGVQLPAGFRTEINLEAVEWLSEIASCLKKGYIITIDYGGTSNDLYNSRKSNGTLTCYQRHSINDQLYQNIGQQDITSHVNFSALQHWGLKYGLDYCGYTGQANFLLSLGFKELLRKSLEQEPDFLNSVKKESFLTHQLLVEMGNKFKVLIQKKGIPDHALLGLKLSG